MIDLPGNPVFAALQDQLSEDETAPVNLMPIWIAAGRPRKHSPRRLAKRGSFEVVTPASDGPGGAVLVDQDDALWYACRVNEDVMDAVCEAAVERRRADPVGAILAAPGSLSASIVLSGVMADEGLDRDRATRRIMAEVLERTEGMTEMDRETLVAQIQRGLNAVQFVEFESD